MHGQRDVNHDFWLWHPPRQSVVLFASWRRGEDMGRANLAIGGSQGFSDAIPAMLDSMQPGADELRVNGYAMEAERGDEFCADCLYRGGQS